jgi:SAM-dependent methyltransferase
MVGMLRRMAMGYVTSQVVRAAAQLGIAEHLAGGPASAAELAQAIGADQGALTRFLRACAVFRLIHEVEPERFELAPLGRALAADSGRLASLAIAMAGPNLVRPGEQFAEVVRTGLPSAMATLGCEFWEYFDAHPDESDHYAQSMAHLSAYCASAVAGRFDLSRFARIIDVGGASGALLSGLLDAAPQATGVLYDRPAVIEHARALLAGHRLGDRIELIPGDFRADVPAGGDLYTIKSVLLDWDDDQAARIVGNIYRAAGPGATLLVIDLMLPDEPADGHRTGGAVDAAALLPLTDFGLLATTGGKIRTKAEFAGLITGTGFTVKGVTSCFDGLNEWHLIEATR